MIGKKTNYEITEELVCFIGLFFSFHWIFLKSESGRVKVYTEDIFILWAPLMV